MTTQKLQHIIELLRTRLDALDDGASLTILDRDVFANLLQEAYENLWQIPIHSSPQNHPGKHELFEFEENDNPTEESIVSEDDRSASQLPNQKPEEGRVAASSTLSSTGIPHSEEEAKSKTPNTDPPSSNASVDTSVSETGESANGSEKENTTTIPQELQEIFAVKASKELSDRLSQLPIDDIWTAMGLNERIFTQNELFGGDSDVFKQTVQSVNQMASFTEAKNFLAQGPATNYDWSEPKKIKIAQNFVRLVHRRFRVDS